MNKRTLWLPVLILIIISIPLGAVSAAQGFDRIIRDGETVRDDIVIFGGSLLIEEGATVDGDVSVFGGSASVNGHIEGDIVFFGGDTNFSGSVDGDLVIFGGKLNATSSANVVGDCILIGGTLSGDGSNRIGCTSVGEFPPFVLRGEFGPPDLDDQPRRPERVPIIETPRSGIFSRIASVAGWSLLNGILAFVIVTIAPRHLEQTSQSLRRKPIASGVVGLLTMFAVPSLIVILAILSGLLTLVCIGLLGWPILLVMVIAFCVALLLGWVAAGDLLGQRLAAWFKLKNQSRSVIATIGVTILTLAAGLLSALPFWLGGWFWSLMTFLILCAGLGSVSLTRFGTRSYPSEPIINPEKTEGVLETLPAENDFEIGPKDLVE